MDIKHYFIKIRPNGLAISGLLISTVLNWICLFTPYWIRAYEVNWPMTALAIHGHKNGQTAFTFDKSPHGNMDEEGTAAFSLGGFPDGNTGNTSLHQNHESHSNSSSIPSKTEQKNNLSFGHSQSMPYLNSYSDPSGDRTKNKLHPTSVNDKSFHALVLKAWLVDGDSLMCSIVTIDIFH